jgi:hypothetical protein
MDQQKGPDDEMNSSQAGNPKRDQAEGERGQSSTGQSSTGITNRPIDEELSEQQELPERGKARDESFDQSER